MLILELIMFMLMRTDTNLIIKKSHGISEEAIQRRHSNRIPIWTKIHSSCLFEIVNSSQRCSFSYHLSRNSTFLVVELVLSIGSVMVEHVEVIAITACGEGVAVRGGYQGEFIKNCLVLEHLAQLALQRLV